jgi:hypothetical protein
MRRVGGEQRPDWCAWSRDAVRVMQERSEAAIARFGLAGARYDWDLDAAILIFPLPDHDVIADLCVVGSVSRSKHTFCWAWADDVIPPQARVGLETVRDFGKANDLSHLVFPEWHGTRANGLEMAAVAARLLDAPLVCVVPHGTVTMFFALSNLRRVQSRTPRV